MLGGSSARPGNIIVVQYQRNGVNNSVVIRPIKHSLSITVRGLKKFIETDFTPRAIDKLTPLSTNQYPNRSKKSPVRNVPKGPANVNRKETTRISPKRTKNTFRVAPKSQLGFSEFGVEKNKTLPQTISYTNNYC